MSKSAEAFRTISEVAEELQVPKHVLRFWEQKFPQIRPMKRGGGRRYYRPEDLDLLRGIRHLLHLEGYTIRGVQKILRTQGVDEVKQCWKADAPQPIAAPITEEVDQPKATRKTKAKPSKKQSQAKVAALPASGRLPVEVVRSLEGALAELEACRRMLATPLGDPSSRTQSAEQ